MSKEFGQPRVADWRLKSERYRLQGQRCTTCGEVQFPPRPICRNCQEKTITPTEKPTVVPIELGMVCQALKRLA